MNATKPLANVGDFIADSSTGTYIKVTNMGGHFNLYVASGADRVAELCGNYPTAQSACRRASYLRTALGNGRTVQQLVDANTDNQTAVLAEANAVLLGAIDANGRTADEVAEAINADGAQYVAAETAADDELATDVAEIVGDGQGWTRMRHPNRPVRITRTHVFRRELSKPQIKAIRRHEDGIVRLGRGVTGPMLRSVADKGYGTLVMVPGTRYTVSHLVLNTNGHKVADEQKVAA